MTCVIPHLISYESSSLSSSYLEQKSKKTNSARCLPPVLSMSWTLLPYGHLWSYMMSCSWLYSCYPSRGNVRHSCRFFARSVTMSPLFRGRSWSSGCFRADRIWQIAEASAEKPIAFGQINVTGNWDAVSSFEITTYPHVMLFQGFDNHRKYKGAFEKTRLAFTQNETFLVTH
jgi:hypothetical protein